MTSHLKTMQNSKRLREESEAKAKFKRKVGKISLVFVVILVLATTLATGVLLGLKSFDVEHSASRSAKSIVSQSKNDAKKTQTKKSKSNKKKKNSEKRRKNRRPTDSKQPPNTVLNSKGHK